MANKSVVLTDEGLKKLQDELEHLKTVRRKEVADKIKVALSFGDLSENSEYDEAKNEQAIVESRIAELQVLLKNATVVDASELTGDQIIIGSRVRVRDVKKRKEFSYQLVGSTEADPKQGKISDESPIGKALIGHKAGDRVTIEAPAGLRTFEILEIVR